MRYQFIEGHREEFPIRRMCGVLDVSPSGYYGWRRRPVSPREMANQELVKQIREIHAESYQTYGSPRIYEELRDNGVACSENRVARLMRVNGIQAKQSKQYKVTTKTDKSHPVAPNLLDREFTSDRPNEKWTADITYIPTLEGWLYLAVILDLFSRRVVGWAMSARMTSALVIDALNMACRQRQPGPELMHHSDRGSQYTGQPYQQLLKDNLIQVSMSGTGDCYDNAPTESFFGTLKTELVHHARYETRAEAKTDIFFYIEAFYNRRRRHSTLNYVSPAAYEAAYYQRLSVLTLCP